MSRKSTPVADAPGSPMLEPERYEWFEEPRYQFELDRRDFFRVLGGGVIVCLVVADALSQQPQPGQIRAGQQGQVVQPGQNQFNQQGQAVQPGQQRVEKLDGGIHQRVVQIELRRFV